jgi:hypothetical protein
MYILIDVATGECGADVLCLVMQGLAESLAGALNGLNDSTRKPWNMQASLLPSHLL